MAGGPSFSAFGAAHLAILAAVPAAALLLARLVRARPGLERPIRRGLATAIALNELAFYAVAVSRGWIDPPRGLPLDLCDVAAWLAVAALLGAPLLVGELLWFAALAGTTQALFTPDLSVPFPSYPAAKFFLGHGATVAAALFLVLAGGLRVRRGAWWRALLWVNAWAAALLALNLATGTNYMYLREKPAAPSLLDHLGPWPWYLAASEALAAALFFLLELPFRRGTEKRAAPGHG